QCGMWSISSRRAEPKSSASAYRSGASATPHASNAKVGMPQPAGPRVSSTRSACYTSRVPAEVWNPDQYDRFRRERQQPFFDLLPLVRPASAPRVIDLGCGTGELTGELPRRLGARETLGVDSSAAMLERAAAHDGDGLRFERCDIADFAAAESFD